MKTKLRKIKIIPDYMKHTEGSCLFQMGNTKVLCTATIGEDRVPPFCEEKNIGWITAEYGMLPRAGSKRTSRRKSVNSGRTQEIQRLIGRSLRAVVDLEKLGRRTITLDCDVLQADGGTRTASINGAFIALTMALAKLRKDGAFTKLPLKDYLGAVSIGIVDDKIILDLCEKEDNRAQVDMNVVITGRGKFVEVQSTAEGKTFSQEELVRMLLLARKGIRKIIKSQRKIVSKILKD